MAKATRFPIATTAENWPMLVLGIGDTIRPREKTAPDGSPTFSSGCLLKVERNDGSVNVDKSATVHVLKPASEPYEGLHVPKGKIWVQPWTSDGGRLAYSITIEELVPFGARREGGAR